MELLGDEGAHGAVEHPDGKREVEVKKSCQEGWRVSGLQKNIFTFAMVGVSG
jgi:hypothetical protein